MAYADNYIVRYIYQLSFTSKSQEVLGILSYRHYADYILLCLSFHIIFGRYIYKKKNNLITLYFLVLVLSTTINNSMLVYIAMVLRQ